MRREELAKELDRLYREHNRRGRIDPDPLSCVVSYADSADQEVAGLIAACTAYGRAGQIVVNVRGLLDRLGDGPWECIRSMQPVDLAGVARGFRHRWTSEEEMADLLLGIRHVLHRYGSLRRCFEQHHDPESGLTCSGLEGLVRCLRVGTGRNSLLPDPTGGSACKRYHLYLRWMVRHDRVDPGPWRDSRVVCPAHLIVPIDTHMHRIARRLRLTRRKTPDLRTALEVTAAFRRMRPEDPVRYDFALTRYGIHPAFSIQDLP